MTRCSFCGKESTTNHRCVIVAQRPFRVGPDFAAFGRRVLGLLADDTIETDYQFVVRVKQAANDLGIDLEKPRG